MLLSCQDTPVISVDRGEMVVMQAESKRGAITVNEKEKLHILNIIQSSGDRAAIKRAKVLLASAEEKTLEETANIAGLSKAIVTEVKRQWRANSFIDIDKVNAVCFSKGGKRRNKEEVEKKANNILQFNKRISPEVSQNARSMAIVEMAKQEGMNLSQSTVIRFLRYCEEQKVSS